MGRKIPVWQIAVVMLVTLFAFLYCLDILEMLFGEAFASNYSDIHMALVISAIAAAAVAFANGFKWSFLEKSIITTIGRAMQAILILMTVGMLIGSWLAAGIIPTLIYYGLAIMSPGIFLFAACLICSVVSVVIGTSWGTTGTMGVTFVAIGIGLGVSPAMTAGACVSGAYFGDKMSPLSDTTNLSPGIVGGVTLFEHIRYMVWTVTPSLIFALVMYLILGFAGGGGTADMNQVNLIRNAMYDSFNLNPILLICPVLVIVIIALKIPPLPGLFSGIILAIIFGMMFQGLGFGEMLDIMHYGNSFDGSVIPDAELAASLENLLGRGGMHGKMWTISLVLVAMVFGGILDGTGMLATLAEAMLKFAKTTGLLIVVTLVSCIVTNMLTADQYLALIIPGRMYKRAYEDRKLKPKVLSRTIEDGGTMTSSLVPWNTCGATMASFLTVPTVQYAPYAFLNWSSSIVSAFYGFTGIGIEKMTDEEYAEVLKGREAEATAERKALED
jgi:NhaC family Na+:H+ antiporter